MSRTQEQEGVRFKVGGEAIVLALSAFRRNQMRVLDGTWEQCDGCGRDPVHDDCMIVQSAETGGDGPVLACEFCGQDYEGEVVDVRTLYHSDGTSRVTVDVQTHGFGTLRERS